MSFEKLRKALVKMPATGKEGFEGLSARLLSALTADRYYVARSGDQPADAISATGEIAIQGKRYDETPLHEVNFEGEFGRACRSFPNLDCYVLATTRTTAQLKNLADELQDSTGVDVVLLQFDTPDSELPALCVTFWDQIKNFAAISKLGSGFATWATKEAAKPEIVATVTRLRETLTRSTPTASTVKRKLTAYLESRFGLKTATRPSRFRIALTEAVQRTQPVQQLNEWWKKKTKAASIVGEEGMGKSWVASAFSLELLKKSDALVLWVESVDWAGLANLEAVLDAGLMQAGFDSQDVRARLVRKAMTRWADRLLLTLDGVNERAARDTARRLLSQLNATATPPCRVLFTTRPLFWTLDEQCLWNSSAEIRITHFTDEELNEALLRLPVPVPRSELTMGLVEVAKIPRYFRTAIALRERFKSLANVSKEMVLWADLLQKVEEGDPQIREKIGWASTADLKRALAKLARAAKYMTPSPENTSDGYRILQSSFDNRFDQIRFDLAEQRVVLEPAGENPMPSTEHLILGFALHLGTLATAHEKGSIVDLADRFQKELEPVLAQDQLTEALFIALQLSAFPNQLGHRLSSAARSALLFAWTSSQNSHVDLDRLEFWSNQDIEAYLDYIEEVFVEPVSESWAERLIDPLRCRWRKGQHENQLLDNRIRRWLLLVWKSNELPTGHTMTVSGYTLPISRSRSQLVLSCVAVAILAENPQESFLRDLAITWATEEISTQRHRWSSKSDGPVDTERDIHCKQVSENIGPLLRWRFTESIKSKIESLLATAEGDDELLVKGLKSSLNAFDKFGWTRCTEYEKGLRNGTPMFSDNPDQNKNRFADCPELAVRDDFPELCENDKIIISERIEKIFSANNLHSTYSRSHDDLEAEYYLSWFAKHFPNRLAEIASQFRLIALRSSQHPGPALNFANQLPYSKDTVPLDLLFEEAKQCADRDLKCSDNRLNWTHLNLMILALTCFEEKQLREWLTFASERKSLLRQIHCYQMTFLCPLLVPNSVAAFARMRAQSCKDDRTESSDFSESEFDYWACLGGWSGSPDESFNTWVAEQIETTHPLGIRRRHWLYLWFRSAPPSVIAEAIANGSIEQYISDDGLTAMILADRWTDNWSALKCEFARLLEIVDISDAGLLLYTANRTEDLRRWGHVVFNKALQLVGEPAFERKFWGTTIHVMDESGRVVGSTFNEHVGSDPVAETLRPDSDSVAKFFKQPSIEELEKEGNYAIGIWREDREQIEKIEGGALDRFSASHALAAWRDLHPHDFNEYAVQLLTRAVSDTSKAFQVGGFIACVLDLLVPVDPEFALKMEESLRHSTLRVSVINEYGEDSFVAALWKAAGSGNKVCVQTCKNLVWAARTDNELMSHAIAAQAEGAQHVLRTWCAELLNSTLAKERCLAVSLLPWLATEHECYQLEQLAANDPSGWVRKHSQWALEVGKQEASMRRFYEDCLSESDHNLLLARLQVLHSALTPTARWWHRHLHKEKRIEETKSSRLRATLEFFWYDARGECKETPELFGRKLNEYLRGEKLRDLVTPALRLV